MTIGREINDGKAAKTKTELMIGREVVAFVVGSAMALTMVHRFERGVINRVIGLIETADAAHRNQKLEVGSWKLETRGRNCPHIFRARW